MSCKTFAFLMMVPLGLSSWGCAAAGGGGGSRGDRNRITEEELDEFPQWSAYEAIRQLRPSWLMSRGPTNFQGEGGDYPRVSLDGVPLGEIDSLHGISVRDIREMRLLGPADATTRYGTGYPAGIIEIRTKGKGSSKGRALHRIRRDSPRLSTSLI